MGRKSELLEETDRRIEAEHCENPFRESGRQVRDRQQSNIWTAFWCLVLLMLLGWFLNYVSYRMLLADAQRAVGQVLSWPSQFKR